MFSGFLCKKENDFLISLSPCGKNLSFYTKLFSYTHQHLVRMMDQPLVFSSLMPSLLILDTGEASSLLLPAL